MDADGRLARVRAGSRLLPGIASHRKWHGQRVSPTFAGALMGWIPLLPRASSLIQVIAGMFRKLMMEMPRSGAQGGERDATNRPY